MVEMLKSLFSAITSAPGGGIAKAYTYTSEVEDAYVAFFAALNKLPLEDQSKIEERVFPLIDESEAQGFINGYRYALMLARIAPPSEDALNIFSKTKGEETADIVRVEATHSFDTVNQRLMDGWILLDTASEDSIDTRDIGACILFALGLPKQNDSKA